MVDKKRVNLTVSPETKDEWENAVETSTEYGSLSGLIRQSVAHELNESQVAAHAPQGRETQQTEAQTEALDAVTDTLNNIETTLSDLDDRLTNVEKEVTATAQADLKQQVFDALPEYKTGSDISADETQEGKSADDIAEELGTDRSRVYSVIMQLQEQTGAVKQVLNVDGQQFFARESEQ